MNEENINNAKKMMEDGWKAREELKFDEAEKLLKSAREIFEKESDWYNVTECLNHLAYNEKLKAIYSLKKGLAFAEDAYNISRKYSTKEVGVLRALFTLNMTLGNYESALVLIERYISFQKKPEDLADANTHKALCLLRIGKILEALELVNESLRILEKNESVVKDPHISVWITSAMLKKAVILYDLGEKENSFHLTEEALSLAKEKGLKTRILEAEEFLKFLK
jgi:tetratricopeptide (TPR) repeat protein